MFSSPTTCSNFQTRLLTAAAMACSRVYTQPCSAPEDRNERHCLSHKSSGTHKANTVPTAPPRGRSLIRLRRVSSSVAPPLTRPSNTAPVFAAARIDAHSLAVNPPISMQGKAVSKPRRQWKRKAKAVSHQCRSRTSFRRRPPDPRRRTGSQVTAPPGNSYPARHRTARCARAWSPV